MGSRTMKCAGRLFSELQPFQLPVHGSYKRSSCAPCRWFGTAQPNSGNKESGATDTSSSTTSKPPDGTARESAGDQQQNTDQRMADTDGNSAHKSQRSFKDVAQETVKLSSEVAAEMARRLGLSGTDSETRSTGSSWADTVKQVGSSFTRRRSQTDGEHGQGSSSGASEGNESSGTDKGGSKHSIVEQLRSEVARAVLPEWETPSVMKRRTDVNAREIKVGEGPSDLVVQEVPQSWVEKLQERLGNTALARRIAALRETQAMQSVADGYASVKEKLESGDSEVVNRVSEMGERLMAETETARSLREIRMRHPSFDMPSFLRAIKRDVPVVIKAYLEGSSDSLSEYCSDAMLERFAGIYKATVAQGQITDSTILEYSDVDMIDMKMLDDHPVVILHFSVQQINCVRDTYGNVVSGSPDEVNRVYYYWAVQMDGHGMVTEDGQYIPPRWKLIEMLLRGMHHLL